MEHVYWTTGYDLLLKNIVKADGSCIYDEEGNRYFDLESGVWCTPLGHCHPRVNAVIKEQVDKIAHTGYYYVNPVIDQAGQEVLDITGLTGGKCVFLCAGSEAVEFGVQALRKITGKPLLLTLHDSFLSSYGSAGRKGSDEWFILDWSRCLICESSPQCNTECDSSAQCDADCDLFRDIPFSHIGGFVFEPGSSSGLIRFPPQGFIHKLVRCVKAHHGYVQINEVTTGMGRTGKWFGYQHYAIKPDIVSVGKGLGNGYLVSAAVLSKGIVNQLTRKAFRYFQSHINDPLGAAVAREVIRAIYEENLIDRSEILGNYIRMNLQALAAQHTDIIKEVRSRGLMIAIEFNPNNQADYADYVWRRLLEQGYMVTRRLGQPVIRFDPPLNISEDIVDDFLNVLAKIIASCCDEYTEK